MPPSIPKLLTMLNKDIREKRLAVYEFIQLGKEAVEPLIDALLSSRDTDTQAQLIRILAKIGDKRAVPAFTIFLSTQISQTAVNGLKDLNAFEPLYQALASSILIELRRQALSAVSHRLAETDVKLLVSFLDDRDERIRQTAAFALMQARPNIGIWAIKRKNAFQNINTRFHMLSILMKQDNGTIFKILTTILPTADSNLKINILNQLRSVKHERIFKLMIDMLKDSDLTVRSRAARELGTHKCQKAQKDLLIALKDNATDVRRDAAWSLGRLGNPASVDALIPLLKDKEKVVRIAAADSLGLLKDKRAIKVLVPLLKDTQESVQATSAIAILRLAGKKALPILLDFLKAGGGDWQLSQHLSQILGADLNETLIEILKSKHPKVLLRVTSMIAFYRHPLKDDRLIEALIPLLKQPESNIRSMAITALLRTGDSRAIKAVIPLIEDADGNVRYNALRVLSYLPEFERIPLTDNFLKNIQATGKNANFVYQFGFIRLKEAVPLLINWIRDENFSQRHAAIQALGRIKDERAIEVLLWALQISEITKQSRIDTFAARALGAMQAREAVPALIWELRIALANDDFSAIGAISQALGKIGDVQAIDILIKALPRGMAETIFALAKLGATGATKDLVPLLNSKYIPIQEAAVSALWKIGDENAADALLNYLQDAKDLSRIHALEALGRVANSRATKFLMDALYESPYRIRKAAVQGLRRIGHEALPYILKINFKNEKNLLVLRRLIWLCGEIGDKAAMPRLITVVNESYDMLCRAHAIQALGKIGNKEALKSLLTTSKDSSSYIRAATATALGKLKDVDVIATLEILAKDSNENVRRAANYSLKQ